MSSHAACPESGYRYFPNCRSAHLSRACALCAFSRIDKPYAFHHRHNNLLWKCINGCICDNVIRWTLRVSNDECSDFPCHACWAQCCFWCKTIMVGQPYSNRGVTPTLVSYCLTWLCRRDIPPFIPQKTVALTIQIVVLSWSKLRWVHDGTAIRSPIPWRSFYNDTRVRDICDCNSYSEACNTGTLIL